MYCICTYSIYIHIYVYIYSAKFVAKQPNSSSLRDPSTCECVKVRCFKSAGTSIHSSLDNLLCFLGPKFDTKLTGVVVTDLCH